MKITKILFFSEVIWKAQNLTNNQDKQHKEKHTQKNTLSVKSINIANRIDLIINSINKKKDKRNVSSLLR